MAQQVSGKVTDKQTGEGIPGVSILIKGTNLGTNTDAQGFYKVNTGNSDAVLVFSFVGYVRLEEPVNGRSTIDITMFEELLELNELVVTALGIAQEKKALGYSVEKLEPEVLTQVRETNLVNALAGRVAGVQTTNGSSGIGSSSRIVIRGETSLSGKNQPLFVVDGVPISNELIANYTENNENGFQEVDYGNGVADISPDDIASITVLKGPGAAALYGTRAANGVVLIETKDGTSKKGLGVSLNSSVTIEKPMRLPNYQNAYGGGSGGQFAYEDGYGAGVNDGGITSFGPLLDGRMITQYDGPSTDQDGNPVRGGDIIARNGNPITPTPWVAHPDNVADFFQTGITWQNNIAISGNNDLGGFRLSFSNLDNNGIIPNADLKRNGLAFGGNYKFDDKLSAKAYLNYVNGASTHRPGLGYGSENLMYIFTWMGRQNDTEPLKDYWQAGQEGFRQYNFNYQWMDNPYLNVYENTNGFNKDRLLGNASVNFEFTKELNLRLRTGIDYYNFLRQSKRAFSSQRFKNGAYREDEVNFKELNTDLMLTYNKQFSSDFGVTLSAGGNWMEQRISYKGTQAGELSVPGIYNFENSRIPLVIQQQNENKRIRSVYGIGRFSYRSNIFLDLTVRNDWSSTLPAENNSFAYYSASLSTLISDYFVLPPYISYARARISMASVGNDTDPFQLRNTFVFNENYGAFPLVTNASTLLNPDLKPERLNAFEIGSEVWFLNDRFGMDLSVYQNTSKNQIVNLPASAASGYQERVINGGTIRGRGIEVALNTAPIKVRGMALLPFVNFSHNVSRVKELPVGIDQYVTGYASVYASTQNTVFFIASEGGKIGDMYGTGFVKVDGKVLYDANGLPVRDPNLRLLGNYNPDFMVGFGNGLTYRNLGFDFLFDWRQGGTIVSRSLAIGSTSGVLESTLPGREEGIIGEGVVNTGTAENPVYEKNTTLISANEYYNQYFNRANEESVTYSASYLKLRQLNLSYTLPESWLIKIGFAEAKLAFIANNLFVLTENPNFDPELSAMQGRNFAYGVEDMSLPSSRSYGLSLKLNL